LTITGGAAGAVGVGITSPDSSTATAATGAMTGSAASASMASACPARAEVCTSAATASACASPAAAASSNCSGSSRDASSAWTAFSDARRERVFTTVTLAAASVSRKYEVAVFGTASCAVLLAGAFFAVSVRVLAVFFI